MVKKNIKKRPRTRQSPEEEPENAVDEVAIQESAMRGPFYGWEHGFDETDCWSFGCRSIFCYWIFFSTLATLPWLTLSEPTHVVSTRESFSRWIRHSANHWTSLEIKVASYFTELDLRDAFLQMRLHETIKRSYIFLGIRLSLWIKDYVNCFSTRDGSNLQRS